VIEEALKEKRGAGVYRCAPAIANELEVQRRDICAQNASQAQQ
jgi:hypothetical protein